MLEIIFFYLFFGSIALYYGVGLKKILTIRKTPLCYLKDVLKSLFITVSVSSATFLLEEYVFARLGISEIYPFFMTIFFAAISYGIHRLIKTRVFDFTEDYIVPFMIVLMSLTEGFSFLSTILICVSGVLSFYLLILFVFALRTRFKIYQKDAGEKPFFMLLLGTAVLFIAIYGFNASWLNLGLIL
ncbi:hypothetical protein SAMN02745152_00312 [Treponema berlinense]|uniref:Uncharacterized protein n=1 Tax=Treponema berlinense TaxID=225004 RepID=A0A1T4KU23_9SPIR|nr:hypothetical protein [Treponema berlinense]MCI5541000.1 hypothetical protein [Treponema berlinense]MDD5835190.1 hypothetical protein [Treponema berlinense]MDY3706997.1 hypothetical protein [Treponema berlinense]SJZ45896.1 hypothetical protein SAMN02745152_00312 [Treponema berlinense]